MISTLAHRAPALSGAFSPRSEKPQYAPQSLVDLFGLVSRQSACLLPEPLQGVDSLDLFHQDTRSLISDANLGAVRGRTCAV